MPTERFTLADLFASAEFHSENISSNELEDLLKDVIKKAHPGDSVKKFKYTKKGIEAVLKNGDKIIVDIDWNEIILS